MKTHNDLFVRIKCNMEWYFKIDKKIRKWFQQPQQFATKTDLAINGFNLNKIININQQLFTDEKAGPMFDLPIHDELLEYLQEKYLHSCQQNIATLVMSNIYFVGKQASPSHQLILTFINLIQKGSAATIDNCIILFANAALDFPKWKQKMINQYGICQILSQSLQRRDLERKKSQFRYIHNYKVIQAMVIFLKNSHPNNTFKFYFKSLTPFLTFTSDQLKEVSQLIYFRAYTCIYWLMRLFPQDSAVFIINHNLYERIEDMISKCVIHRTEFAFMAVWVLQLLLQNNQLYQHKFTTTYFIEKIIKLIKREDTFLQAAAYPILVKFIEEQRISGLDIVQQEFFQKRLKVENQQPLLYCLIKIYSNAESKANDQKYTEKVKEMFEEVKSRCPKYPDLIKFIDESIKSFNPV